MTLDERLERLVNADEELRQAHQRQIAVLDRLTVMVLDISESTKRLERIAGVLMNDEELDRRLTELEHKAQRKPQ